ncbi:MAG: hypothetical protein Sapg2KO_49560 [Saprospiraceae bacterium]
MYNILVIEDEPRVMRMIYYILEQSCLRDIQLIGTGYSVQEGLQQVRCKQPEIVITDIKLGDGNSFEIFRQLEESAPKIIFLTAYERFAVPSFQFSPVDFLIKPLIPEHLIRAVQKAIAQIKIEQTAKRQHVKQDGKIQLQGFKGIHQVDIKDIIRFEADRNYALAVLSEQKRIRITKGLSQVEAFLGGLPFLRVHKSHLVNVDHIERFSMKYRTPTIIMDNQEVIPVARRRKQEVLQWIKQTDVL